jgi:hypothetical protein
LSGRTLEVNGRKVWLLENGSGAPFLYLHGFADVTALGWLPFHERSARPRHRPAHPGCAQTDENKDIDAIEDVVFISRSADALKHAVRSGRPASAVGSPPKSPRATPRRFASSF